MGKEGLVHSFWWKCTVWNIDTAHFVFFFGTDLFGNSLYAALLMIVQMNKQCFPIEQGSPFRRWKFSSFFFLILLSPTPSSLHECACLSVEKEIPLFLPLCCHSTFKLWDNVQHAFNQNCFVLIQSLTKVTCMAALHVTGQVNHMFTF